MGACRPLVGVAPDTGGPDRADALSGALVRCGRWPAHDRARVLADLAVMIAEGREETCDIDVLRHQQEMSGALAWETTVGRALEENGATQLRRGANARAAVRAGTSAPVRGSWI